MQGGAPGYYGDEPWNGSSVYWDEPRATTVLVFDAAECKRPSGASFYASGWLSGHGFLQRTPGLVRLIVALSLSGSVFTDS